MTDSEAEKEREWLRNSINSSYVNVQLKVYLHAKLKSNNNNNILFKSTFQETHGHFTRIAIINK